MNFYCSPLDMSNIIYLWVLNASISSSLIFLALPWCWVLVRFNQISRIFSVHINIYCYEESGPLFIYREFIRKSLLSLIWMQQHDFSSRLTLFRCLICLWLNSRSILLFLIQLLVIVHSGDSIPCRLQKLLHNELDWRQIVFILSHSSLKETSQK